MMNLLKYIFSKKYREEASSRYSYNITKKIDKYNVSLEKLYSDISKKKNNLNLF